MNNEQQQYRYKRINNDLKEFTNRFSEYIKSRKRIFHFFYRIISQSSRDDNREPEPTGRDEGDTGTDTKTTGKSTKKHKFQQKRKIKRKI